MSRIDVYMTQAPANWCDDGCWNGGAVAVRRSMFPTGVRQLRLSRRLRGLSSVSGLQKTDQSRPLQAGSELDRCTCRHLLASNHARWCLAVRRVLLVSQAACVDVAAAGAAAVAWPQRTVKRRGSPENILHQCCWCQFAGHRSRRRRRDVQTRAEQFIEEEASVEETERRTCHQVVTGLNLICLFD